MARHLRQRSAPLRGRGLGRGSSVGNDHSQANGCRNVAADHAARGLCDGESSPCLPDKRSLFRLSMSWRDRRTRRKLQRRRCRLVRECAIVQYGVCGCAGTDRRAVTALADESSQTVDSVRRAVVARSMRDPSKFVRRTKQFRKSTQHHAENHRLLCMGLFSTFLFWGPNDPRPNLSIPAKQPVHQPAIKPSCCLRSHIGARRRWGTIAAIADRRRCRAGRCLCRRRHLR